MEAGSSTMVTAAKLPVLNPGEFELWKMRIEQYFLMTDYALWEVIVNGDSPPPKRTIDGVEQTYPPTTAEEKLARKNELKARGTLLMALPNEHQLKFNTYKCAKTQKIAIEKGECYNCHKKGHFAKGVGRALRENGNKELVRRNVTVETTETKLGAQDGHGYDWSLESVEARLDMYKKNEVVFEEDIKILKLDIKLRDNALTELRKKFEKAKKERDDLKLTLEKFRNSSKNLSKLLEIQVSDKFKTGVGFDSQVVDSHVFDSQENERYKTSEEYHAVPPPYIGNFIPLRYDLILADEENCFFVRHMTGNKSYLSDYEEIDGGFVAFGGDPKGGRITSKGKISTDTECVVLSPDFKLLDENHVLLRVPRKDNMYSVDLKNIVPSGGLTCLFAKATLDESNLWHRRLGHINFKTLNKLVRGNLVRGRKPALSFMRPFGCPITILNTLDHLGKFDGKADEGFFVGYSTNSKAYRVFNNRTRIVEENLYVKFSEETPNIARNGPNWLFDIDALTMSMSYKLVVAGNQKMSFQSAKSYSLYDTHKRQFSEEKKSNQRSRIDHDSIKDIM
ncbi:putative ribonuclease H-like domain-containing protein [Tanacetum coccineum]|uniref:Ribonuclease H-like domain-containing protein n=1 Tax=Tanacetum coccineum TaxID=301880 RepID=A0ABQ4Y5Q6_9ASTR